MLETYRAALRNVRRAYVLCAAGLTLALLTCGLAGCGPKEDASASATSSGDGYGTPAGGSTTGGGTATSDTSGSANQTPAIEPARGGGQTPGGG
jgi:hypothetical protein